MIKENLLCENKLTLNCSKESQNSFLFVEKKKRIGKSRIFVQSLDYFLFAAFVP